MGEELMHVQMGSWSKHTQTLVWCINQVNNNKGCEAESNAFRTYFITKTGSKGRK